MSEQVTTTPTQPWLSNILLVAAGLLFVVLCAVEIQKQVSAL